MKRKNIDFLFNVLLITLTCSILIMLSIVFIKENYLFLSIIKFILIGIVIIGILIIILSILSKKNIRKINEQIYQSKDLLLNNILMPFIITDIQGNIISYNSSTLDKFIDIQDYKNIKLYFDIKTNLEEIKSKTNLIIDYENVNYRIEVVPFENENKKFLIFYFYNITELVESKKSLENERLIQGLIYVDNYEEVLVSTDDIKKSLMFFILEKRIRKYFSNYDAIVQKIDRDKFLILMKNRYFKDFQSDKFSILESVKKIRTENKSPLTLSIGLVDISESYIDSYEQAISAVDMALARGGDQVVFKTKNKVYYYGGRSKSVEKNTTVKARVKANALKTVIENREKVLIMGHKLADIDCVGASIGVYTIAKLLDKEVHIVIDDIINSVKPCINGFINDPTYPSDMFITPRDAYRYVGHDTTLIIVDVNAKEYTEEPELIDLAGQVVVIDHHRKSEKSINNAVLDYVGSASSSTCEMITAVLQHFKENSKKIDIKVLEALYAGILIDTNSFVNKVGVRTFEAAAYLKKNGVDIDKVRKMFREDSIRYKAKAQTISDAYEFSKGYLIGALDGDYLDSPTELGAQAANELLNIENIKASIILTKVAETIYVSLRSIDEVNVQLVAERLGGGGHQTIAGAQLHNINIDEAKVIVINLVNKMIEEGEV